MSMSEYEYVTSDIRAAWMELAQNVQIEGVASDIKYRLKMSNQIQYDILSPAFRELKRLQTQHDSQTVQIEKLKSLLVNSGRDFEINPKLDSESNKDLEDLFLKVINEVKNSSFLRTQGLFSWYGADPIHELDIKYTYNKENKIAKIIFYKDAKNSYGFNPYGIFTIECFDKRWRINDVNVSDLSESIKDIALFLTKVKQQIKEEEQERFNSETTKQIETLHENIAEIKNQLAEILITIIEDRIVTAQRIQELQNAIIIEAQNLQTIDTSEKKQSLDQNIHTT